MGADMLLACMPHFEPTDDRRRVLEEALREVVIGPQDVDSMNRLEFQEELEYERQQVLSAFDCDTSREVTVMPIDGKWWRFSGGPSWGDSPTEAYQWICAAGECDRIWKLFQQWQAEDSKTGSNYRIVARSSEPILDALSKYDPEGDDANNEFEV